MREIHASVIADAVKKLDVEGFPAIVVNDCHDGDLYQDGMKQYARE